MKAGASGINAHILLAQTTRARLLKVTRQADGQVFGFTNHDLDLVFGGVTYKSLVSFGDAFNISDKIDAGASDSEVTGGFDSIITREDAVAELWDHATLQMLEVNWASLTDGAIILFTGSLGEFEPQEFGFRVSVHGLEYPLTFLGGEICSPGCRVDFGSPRCAPSGALADGTTINSLLQALTVTATDGTRSITVSGLSNTGKPFDGGLATFLTGNNPNLSVEVLHVDFTTHIITLRPWTQIGLIQVGDTLKLFPACDKTFFTCSTVWLNGVNNQAEPHALNPDASLEYPDYVAPHK